MRRLHGAPRLIFTLVLLCGHARALDLPAVVNGHAVNVIGKSDLPISQLLIDGAITVEAFDVDVPGQVMDVAGVPVILVEVHAGGNACEGPMPAIITLPSGGAPQIFGPLENCSPLEVQVGENQITFVATTPAEKPALYVWAPDRGFTNP